MGVVESQREEGRLHVETLARKYLKYAVDSTRGCFQKPIAESSDEDAVSRLNEKNENAKWYADKLREYAVELLAEIIEANACDIESEFGERIIHQKMAVACIVKTKAVVTELYDERIIKSKKLKAWLGELKKVNDPLRRWIRSDAERKSKMGSR